MKIIRKKRTLKPPILSVHGFQRFKIDKNYYEHGKESYRDMCERVSMMIFEEMLKMDDRECIDLRIKLGEDDEQ